MIRNGYWFVLLAVAATTAMRVVEHPWNLAPAGALALFAGTYFRNKKLAFAVPLLAMFVGDVTLGLVRNNMSFYTFHKMMPVVYGCYALNVCLGFLIRRSWSRMGTSSGWRRVADRAIPVAGATLFGAILFFIITNFGDWLLYYDQSWAGLTKCYLAALPFFRTTLVGDAFYVFVLFSGYELLKDRVRASDKTGLLRAK